LCFSAFFRGCKETKYPVLKGFGTIMKLLTHGSRGQMYY
jgi:hypothetical protein